MNKNTKSARSLLGKSKTAISVVVAMKVSGNRGSGYNTRTWNLSFGYQARRSKKPKVAAGRSGSGG